LPVPLTAAQVVVATQLQEVVEPRVQVMAQLEPMAFVPEPD
jgi:hypothetical protein